MGGNLFYFYFYFLMIAARAGIYNQATIDPLSKTFEIHHFRQIETSVIPLMIQTSLFGIFKPLL